MTHQITMGLIAEGPTDQRFLSGIIKRSFEHIAFECPQEIEIFEVRALNKPPGDFVSSLCEAAKQAENEGIMVLCVHTDADDSSDENVFRHKISPALAAINSIQDDPICQNLVPIVPIQMTEAWMLADIELLKFEIGTNKREDELGLHRLPETYPDPKTAINEAIRIASDDLPKRRRRSIGIGELYAIIGQKIDIEKLAQLGSYKKFQDAIRDAFRRLNYLH